MKEFLNRKFCEAIVIIVLRHSSTILAKFGLAPSYSRIEANRITSFSHRDSLFFFDFEVT